MKVGFKVGFKNVSLFFWVRGFLSIFIDHHPPAMAVLFPCSLSQGFKEAAMGIKLCHFFHFFLTLRCIATWGVLHIQVSARD